MGSSQLVAEEVVEVILDFHLCLLETKTLLWERESQVSRYFSVWKCLS